MSSLWGMTYISRGARILWALMWLAAVAVGLGAFVGILFFLNHVRFCW